MKTMEKHIKTIGKHIKIIKTYENREKHMKTIEKHIKPQISIPNHFGRRVQGLGPGWFGIEINGCLVVLYAFYVFLWVICSSMVFMCFAWFYCFSMVFMCLLMVFMRFLKFLYGFP